MPDAPSREFTSLLQQVAHTPSGAATLRDAHLDCAATTLHLHPFVVDAARCYLEAVDGWAAVEDEVGALDGDAAQAVGADVALLLEGESEEARSLIDRAEADPRGATLLCEGDSGEIAATYGVHPYVVFRARGALERKAICTKKR